MSKVSSLARPLRDVLPAMLLVASMTLIAGCGGGSQATGTPPVGANPPAPPAPPPAPPPVEGVATPSSVAVVTATNAQ
jgi:hypothetical protein